MDTMDTSAKAARTPAPKRIGRPPRDPMERFWEKVDMGLTADSCWEWTGAGSRTNYGYGYFFDGIKQVNAYRFAYSALVGPIPEGLTIDHLCRNPPCVRPDHLEPVTLAENLARSDRSRPHNGEHYRIRTHCPSGHEYTPDNTGREKKDGSRYCRMCKKLASRVKRAKAA